MCDSSLRTRFGVGRVEAVCKTLIKRRKPAWLAGGVAALLTILFGGVVLAGTYQHVLQRPSTATWRIGLPDAAIVVPATGTAVGSTASTSEQSPLTLQRLLLLPGTYKLSDCREVLRVSANATVDNIWVVIYETPYGQSPGGTTVLTRLYKFELDVSAHSADAAVHYTGLDNTFTLTGSPVSGGKYYWIGFACHKTAGGNGSAGTYRLNDSVTTSYTWGGSNWTEPPATINCASSPPTGPAARVFQQFTITTSVRKLWSGAYNAGASTNLLIPVRTDGVSYITAQSLRLNSGGAVALDLHDVAANGSDFAVGGAKLDFSTSPGTFAFGPNTGSVPSGNDFGGAPLSLGASEVYTDYIDLYLWMDTSHAGRIKTDTCIVNRTHGQGVKGAADLTIISYNAKTTGAHGAASDFDVLPSLLSVPGSGVVSSLSIGWEPIVALGDSLGGYAQVELADQAYGLSQSRIVLYGTALGGNKLCADGPVTTAGYKRYKHDTPGMGDICDLRSMLLVIPSFGMNDVMNDILGTGTEEQQNASAQAKIAEMVSRISGVAQDARLHGNEMLIIGLTPPGPSYQTTAVRRAAVQQYNLALLDMSAAVPIACYDPYDDVWAHADTYLSSDQLHMTNPGRQAVAHAAAVIYETERQRGPAVIHEAFGVDFFSVVPVAVNGDGSGVLVDPSWVLTAADVVGPGHEPAQLTIDGQSYPVARTIRHPDWDPNDPQAAFLGYDLALLQLTTAVPAAVATPALRYDGAAEVGQSAWIVGWGRHGTGLEGSVNAGGVRRAGRNMIDLLGLAYDADWSSNLLVVDFDNLDPAGPCDPNAPCDFSCSRTGTAVADLLEYQQAPGDSGGGWFIEINGERRLAGIAGQIVDGCSTGSTVAGFYGSVGTATRIAPFNDWINRHTIYEHHWKSAVNGAFSADGNWDYAMPLVYHAAIFDAAGSYVVALSSSVTTNELLFDNNAHVTFDGTYAYAVQQEIRVFAAGELALLSGGTITAAEVAVNDAATISLNGATLAISGVLAIGDSSGSSGTLTLSGGVLRADTINIGCGGVLDWTAGDLLPYSAGGVVTINVCASGGVFNHPNPLPGYIHVVQSTPGDLNCDGVGNLADIAHFVQALVDPAAYDVDHDGDPYPACERSRADLNHDGLIDGADIMTFIEALLAA